ncbi:MAG: rRNA pseudouridine synthase [Chitinophagales bacterium]|jgi:23S rRNA pseudouridine2605 synthase|nr:rRNA pseudouridine synthase [Chitinophagales bacterium]MBP6153889.1 rRNA pseudouridine synthase [Chitinophagales bacterium]HRB67890.1 pseudouridine synthase [Chitinophagales bacterium]HRB68771.1 pseudouridine synthase [Chitinophagales bacterium]HRB91820.1 pseudouridine synthase [Chitinophagales bacterium]
MPIQSVTSANKTNFHNKKKQAGTKNDPFAYKIEQVVKNFTPPKEMASLDETRLNKFISNAGVCSRRQADEYIKAGYVTVNDEVVIEMGYKVKPNDTIKFKNKKVQNDKKVYILLNKPKGYLTTVSDDRERKTVMELVNTVKDARIYPVGRLDRNSSGILLLTNDGELAQKLSHPSGEVTKVYQVELDKPLESKDLLKIREGVVLEDGKANVDQVDYTLPRGDDKYVGVELHSGKNRIVRRIFESLGYEVQKLDRVLYAGLTKKNLPRGKWRFLTEKEVIFLKYFTANKKEKKPKE